MTQQAGLSKTLIIVAIAVAAAAVAAFVMFSGDDGGGSGNGPVEPATTTTPQPTITALIPKTTAGATTTTTLRKPAYTDKAVALAKAREALKKGIDPAEAVKLAKNLPDSDEKPDAVFLLLEYAADSGDMDAALEVGRFYDPTDDIPSGSIQKNASQAYDWYKDALFEGRKAAEAKLTRLKKWVEQHAAQGDKKAKELLKRWK